MGILNLTPDSFFDGGRHNSSEKAELQAAVDSVRPESLDADVVDFEARKALNLLRPDEVVIPLGASQQRTK